MRVGAPAWVAGSKVWDSPTLINTTPPPPPLFQGPDFPESARNVSPNQWISDSGGKKDHLLKVFVLW